MKFEIGEYVKDIYARIGKIISYSNGTYFTEKFGASSGEIVKHSKNIIDLIEVGDIVEIYDVLHNDIFYIWSEDMLKALKEDVENGIHIKTIATKEQFKNIEYRLED